MNELDVLLHPSETESADSDLWHTCREHPFASDPPCHVGCKAFCGYVYQGRLGSSVSGRGGADWGGDECVVCVAMRPTRRVE